MPGTPRALRSQLTPCSDSASSTVFSNVDGSPPLADYALPGARGLPIIDVLCWANGPKAGFWLVWESRNICLPMLLAQNRAAWEADGEASMGDRSKFEGLVAPLLDSMYRTALRMTKNTDDAEDLVQETCLKAFRYFDRFEEGSNLRAWLFKILTNLFINRYRKQAKEPTRVEYDESEDFYLWSQMVKAGAVSEHHGPEKDLFDRMLGSDVTQAIDELPEDFRIVVVMAFIEGLSYEEIAAALDVPMGTVKSRLHRGRKMLQKSLYHYARKAGVIPSS